MPDGEHERRGGRSGCGDELATGAGTELTGDKRHQHDHAGDDHGREDPEAARRLAEQCFAHPAEERSHRSLVVVTERGMPGRRTEVQLVAVVAVAIAVRHLNCELGEGDRQNEAPGDRRKLSQSVVLTASASRATSDSSL